MPLMGALYVGASGLQTSQNALNTTAHNLANIDTTGYTRQQVYQGNRDLISVGSSYNNKLQAGLGVAYTDVRAVRDEFMDRQYRTEAGRSAYYSTSYEAIREINNLFGETEGAEFQTSLQNLRDALEDLSKSPADSTVQSALVTTAAQFLDRAKAVYDDLCTYQKNLNQQIIDQVDKVNDYAKQIAELNLKITGYEMGGIESPNDLRDARDQLLDELSAYGRVTYKEDLRGMVSVFFEGVSLVRDTDTNPMEAKVIGTRTVGGVEIKGDEDTGFVTPVWSRYNDQEVFNKRQEINADIGSDSGSIKALLYSRGYKNGTWMDVLNDPPGQYNGEYERVQLDTYNDFVGPAGFSIAETQAEFDSLIHDLVTSINDLLTEENTNGSPKLFMRITPATPDEYDSMDPTTYTDRKTDFDTEVSDKELEKLADRGGIYLAAGEGENFTFTISNLTINKSLLREPTKLCNRFVRAEDETVDYERAKMLADLFSTDKKPLNPNMVTELSYESFYIEIVNQYSNVGNTYKNVSESQETSMLSIENARQQVMGVSDNEELSKLIRYQNAYNASSRYINTVNSMLDNLLNNLT